MNAGSQDTNWIPRSFQLAATNLAKDAIERFVKPHQIIGLGSGPMAAAIVREMANFDGKETLECIPTSFQIKLEAQCSGLRLIGEDRMIQTDVVFDGADEIDASFNMIKGGGGALLREKVVHSAANQIIIAAESNKFLQTFSWPVPIEIHPFAIEIVRKKLEDLGGKPKMRMLKEGYPYITENGNFIIDGVFELSSDIRRQEFDLKNIPGVIEVGLFTKHATAYYKAKEDGSFEIIENP
ncbi:MAG: ribose 5-phosphate isomerase A [Nitrososphaera sp.]